MSMSDQDAVLAALRDPEAFSIIIERYKAPLSGYIRRLAALDPDSAKDILQESFIKVYLNLNDYDLSLPFSSWIYRITHNEVMMHLRSNKNRAHAFVNGDALALFEHISDELDLLKEADGRLRGSHIAEAMQRIRPKYRDLLILRFFQEKSYAEISDILEIPEGTVATNLARGKAALRAVLKDVNITSV